MKKITGLLLKLLAMTWMTQSAATSEESYYFKDDPKTIARAEAVTINNWPPTRTVRSYKFDLSTLPVDQMLDPKLKTLGLLTQENVYLVNSNLTLEQKLSNWIVNGDPSIANDLQSALRARAALVLYKLEPQDLQTLLPLVKVLREDSHFRMRQVLTGIFVKASPRLSQHMVNTLKYTMKNDPDSPTRSLATLAVILNSENNPENLQEAIEVMMEDHQDMMHVLQPWSVVRDFIDQSTSHVLETPTRAISSEFKAKILKLVRHYQKEGSVLKSQTRYVRFKLLQLEEM